MRGVIRGTAVAIAGDILVEDGGTITGDAIAVLGGVITQRTGAVAGTVAHVHRARSPGSTNVEAGSDPARRDTV